MIEITNLHKEFDDITALESVTACIEEGHVYGLIGTNGAGKSTLLRTIAGIYRPDRGNVKVDGEEVYENTELKAKIFYISDDQFFLSGSTPQVMADHYKTYYPGFDTERFEKLLGILDLDKNRKISTFSKGMKKQLSVVIGICVGSKYLLCDETFDGLDPVMRQAVKRLFVDEMDKRDFTPIIASHNLRELEDICEHVGLLHKGGVVFSKDLDEMKLGVYKIQFVPGADTDKKSMMSAFDVLTSSLTGSLITMTVRASREEIESKMLELSPVFWEILPLSLEEIFINETEVLGYDFTDLTV
ncbi:MAG: ABC transporter ATP-binding protein [Acetatifactor sp.]|nr:ABC transporter ATP-binding protein [Acetatifactor sp.]